jgi:hypothetical protein
LRARAASLVIDRASQDPQVHQVIRQEIAVIGIIAIIVAVLLATLLIYAATRPDIFRLQRTTLIKAPPEKIFALINDFHSHGWGCWSPWEKLDPNLKRTFGGAASGKGAVYEWAGNGKAGAGRMEITQAAPPSHVAIKLDFRKPIEGHNIAEFTLEPSADSTKVTWAMHGANRYIGKLMGVFVDMDRLIGKDFETGLANMKRVAEQ